MGNKYVIPSLIFYMAFAATAVDGACDAGFTAYGSSCYKPILERLTQPKAHDSCHALGAKLASIHSESEQNFILGLLDQVDPGSRYRFWIGLTLTATTGAQELISCSWTDGSKFDYGECKEKSGNAPWAHSTGHDPEPNSGEQACITITHFKKNNFVGWVDDHCDKDADHDDNYKYGALCKK